MKNKFLPSDLYRLPWNLADNAISWLEPTSKCNLYCDGCYRENKSGSHKTMEEITHELEIFKQYRKTDGVSIAGGEPLTHPQITEIVRLVKKMGWKAIINSNGGLLTEPMLKELKKAGVDGFTFHVDSGQKRKGWEGADELRLNELRLQLATMLAKHKISCSFNATIYPENVKYVPQLLRWAQEHMDKVHVMVFIIYRMAVLGRGFDFYAGDKKVNFDDMMYSKNDDDRTVEYTAPELVELIRTEYPDFMPGAFLNGTENVDSYKWLLTGRLGNRRQIFGYTGPKFNELVQIVKHLFTDSYLAYSAPEILRLGRLFFLLSFMDKGIRNAAANYFRSFITDLAAFLLPVHHQSVMIIQPADIYADGAINMCDGCPDITIWNDKLVWSCRMEEQNKWGMNVRAVPMTGNDKIQLN